MLEKCCGKTPTYYVPAFWGNIQINPLLKRSIECDVCRRSVVGGSDYELEKKWNAINIKETKTMNTVDPKYFVAVPDEVVIYGDGVRDDTIGIEMVMKGAKPINKDGTPFEYGDVKITRTIVL